MKTQETECINIGYQEPKTRPGYLYAEGNLSDLIEAVRVRRKQTSKKNRQAEAKAKNSPMREPEKIGRTRQIKFIPIEEEIPEEGNQDLNDVLFNRHQRAKREREEAQAEAQAEAKIINARIPKIPHPEDIGLYKAVVYKVEFLPLWQIYPRGLKGHSPREQVIKVTYYMRHKTAKSTGREQTTLYQPKPFFLSYYREEQIFIGKGKKIFKYLSQKMGGIQKGTIIPIYWSHNRGKWQLKIF